MPANIPAFKLSFIIPDICPTTVGPTEQPISPPRANKANMVVPPFGREDEAVLNVPGHIIPTERPQAAHAIRLSCGMGSKDMPK